MATPRCIEFDPEAGAMYVRFTEEPVARSVEADGYVVDHAADSAVVGIELLSPTPAILREAGQRFGFLDFLQEIARASTPPAGSCTTRSHIGIIDLTGPQTQSRPRVPVQELQIA